MQDIKLPKIYVGKVRTLYEINSQKMLMVASDNLSAFDVILKQQIPDKGKILTKMSLFWFNKLSNIIKNHLTGDKLEDFLSADDIQKVQGRAIVVKKLTPAPIEAIVRGYLIGNAWKEYQKTSTVNGILLPKGLRLAEKLPDILFTPTTKAEVGKHDENISFEECQNMLGAEKAEEIKQVSLKLYQEAYNFALQKGIIIADTKFEFGYDEQGNLVLMDEVLTPDSSRFWSKDNYKVGENPASFDKQFIRDWLVQNNWQQKADVNIPHEIILKTREKYQEALTKLTDE